ncbi:MAG: YbaK/EbsC family protein [Actinobacteria bacterium]|nr:YbaK/EbsC family protein [Actinomycetota bacterium]
MISPVDTARATLPRARARWSGRCCSGVLVRQTRQPENTSEHAAPKRRASGRGSTCLGIEHRRSTVSRRHQDCPRRLVFAVDGEIVMAYVSGANQLDEKKLAAAAGGTKCSRVDADAVREATGFPIGGVPPFGHSTQLRVFVDPDLLQYDEVWAAAGTWNDNFGAAPADIVRVAGGVVTDLKRS